jgi:integrase
MAAQLGHALGRSEVWMTRLGRAIGPGQLTKRGEHWVLDYRAGDGRRVREVLSTDKRVAERIRAKRISQRDLEMSGLGAIEGQSRPLEELRDAFMADLATRASRRYIAYARQRIDDVLRGTHAKRVCDARPYELIQLRARMLTAGLSPTPANHKIDTLRSMLSWAVKVGLIAENPLAHIPRLPQPERTRVHRRRAMSEDEITRFLDAARADDREALERRSHPGKRRGRPGEPHWPLRRLGIRIPQAPMWRAFLECGCRYGELTRAMWADLDLDRRTLFLRSEHTKSGRSRQIPLLDGLVAELRELREIEAQALRRPVMPSDPVFMSPEACAWPIATRTAMRIFDRVLEAAGIDRLDHQGRKLDIHALRHSAASRLLRAGVPLQKVQHILGHADARMTSRIYAHLSVEDLRDAVEAIPQGERAGASRRDAG